MAAAAGKKLLTYYPCPLSGAEATPLVVLLPWLRAQSSHVEKYCKVYHERRHNVVTFRVQAQHFLWPKSAVPAVAELVEHLRSNAHRDRKLLFHSFSVGSYLYSVLLREMLISPNRYSDIALRIVGQVFDSITVGGLGRMATGSAVAASSNPAMQKVISTALMSYFGVTRPWTTKIYDECINAFVENPVRTAPILYFYCLNDPMADSTSMRSVIDRQTQAGHTVTSKCWHESRHAAHLILHPDEYKATLDAFLKSCGCSSSVISKL